MTRIPAATTFEVCDQIQKVDFGPGLEYTITWLPGSQYSLYFLSQFRIYPSLQKLADGRMLADVPAKEWATLPEIAEKPLSMAPFVLKSGRRAKSMTFEGNEYFEPAPALKSIVIQFFARQPDRSVAALLGGDVDYLEKSTLGAGAEVQTVLDAAEGRQAQG